MSSLRILEIASWVALPTVMFGGYSLLRLLARGGVLSDFQTQYFRAGHAHAGVLLLMSLLYDLFLERTAFPPTLKLVAAAALLVGILAQSGGFFLHMGVGKPGRPSAGTTLTMAGAAVLALAVALLVYGLIVA